MEHATDVDRAVVLPRDVPEHRVGGDRALFEGPGDGDHLADRAGFVGTDGREVAAAHDRDALLVAIDRHHRDDVAGVGVHHDDLAADRPGDTNLADEHLLGLVLHRAVDRRHEVGSRCRRLQHVLGPGDGDPTGSDFERLLPGTALQQSVVLALQTSGADAVDVGPADDAATGVAAGHDPTVLVVDATRRSRPRELTCRPTRGSACRTT